MKEANKVFLLVFVLFTLMSSVVYAFSDQLFVFHDDGLISIKENVE